ncbi:Wall-associated receptor kinase-like 14 [Camellia lanceoleosa]|uniref:Wall-associated receptor kinase-like 14 n=1 Tax=Camellia lanceoleosa TaxID=1840588 RepID=A0ACC0HSX0_9ERIC|nr:Wall-associated receptor kinase-like 14 [Camellia lanceoleosa]
MRWCSAVLPISVRVLRRLPNPPLQCTANGTAVIDGFPVQTVTSDTILINLPPNATVRFNSRPPLHPKLRTHFEKRNLLQNCTLPITACVIPTTMVQTHFELLDCGSKKKNNISCYSEQNKENKFINYSNVKSQGCESLFSAISVSSMGNSSAESLDVQVVQLCGGPRGKVCVRAMRFVRMSRRRLMDGEDIGVSAWMGPSEMDSSACNPAKYMSGECGGATRVGVLVGALKAVDFNRSQNEVNLASLAGQDRERKVDEIIDPLLEAQTDAWTLSSVHKVAVLAFRCLAYDRDTRPSMIEVAMELEQTGLSRWASSEGNVIVSVKCIILLYII